MLQPQPDILSRIGCVTVNPRSSTGTRENAGNHEHRWIEVRKFAGGRSLRDAPTRRWKSPS